MKHRGQRHKFVSKNETSWDVINCKEIQQRIREKKHIGDERGAVLVVLILRDKYLRRDRIASFANKPYTEYISGCKRNVSPKILSRFSLKKTASLRRRSVGRFFCVVLLLDVATSCSSKSDGFFASPRRARDRSVGLETDRSLSRRADIGGDWKLAQLSSYPGFHSARREL